MLPLASDSAPAQPALADPHCQGHSRGLETVHVKCCLLLLRQNPLSTGSALSQQRFLVRADPASSKQTLELRTQLARWPQTPIKALHGICK